MKAWVISEIKKIEEGSPPLSLVEMEKPLPGNREILIRVLVCGICHTELDEVEGRAVPAFFPIIPGHQVVGIVEQKGKEVTNIKEGDTVGVAWIYSSCGECKFCRSKRENLCLSFKATGKDAHGGYAEYMVVDERYAYKLPPDSNEVEVAPLLCAGAIGYRSLKLCGLNNGDNLGLMGFGASGHIVLTLAKKLYPDSNIFVFARSEEQRKFSLQLGACWAGNIEEYSPQKVHAIIDTTPVWKPVVESLKNLESGGRLVINAIRKENQDKNYLLNIDYGKHLWEEKEIKSVANVTREDVKGMLDCAFTYGIKPKVKEYNFEEANNTLIQIKESHFTGAKTLRFSYR